MGQKEPPEQKPWGETLLGMLEGKQEGYSMVGGRRWRRRNGRWKYPGRQTVDNVGP